MRILFVASMHHPQELAAAQAASPGERVLFPPSMSQHFYERAFKKRGHVLDVFYRNVPSMGSARTLKYGNTLSLSQIWMAASHRLPRANPDYRLRNRRLIEQARTFKPDVLWMTGDNTVIYPETLAAIKAETGCLLVYAVGTSPVVFSHAIDRAAARLYDMVLAVDYYHGIQWLEMGAKRMECLPLSACDPDFHHPYPITEEERAKYACDLAFVGTLVPDSLYSRRVQALEALREFDLGIWSVHSVPDSLKPFVRGKALGEEMLKILSASKICFNIHGDFVFYGGNLRLFESAGSGVFQVVDDLPGIHKWFDVGSNMVTYTDIDDLRTRVRYYLDHDAEREAVARASQAHVYAHHTYLQRVAAIENLLDPLLSQR